MKLYQTKDLNEETRLEDVAGKSLLAMDVFSLSIKALTSHLLQLLETEGMCFQQNEIRWVLTVPAIWPDKAKQFMRKSAEKAGIYDILIALEPEAASIHCQYLPTEKLKGASEGFKMCGVGQKYMVVDVGGGTADITVHEKMAGGQLKELCHASRDECGGTSIDNAFIQLLIKILGAPLVTILKQEDPSAYLDLLREFETVKRKIKTTTKRKVNFTIPCATINTLCEKHQNESLSSMIQSSPFASCIALRGDKLRIDAEIMKALFQPTIEKIVSLVNGVLKNPSASDVPLLLLVGGLSECEMIHSGLKTACPEKRIIIPEEAGLSVLKGAVLFGHKPTYIASRVMRYSYGTDICGWFDPSVHDNAHKTVIRGDDRCRDLFGMIMKKNASIPVGTKITQSYTTGLPFEDQMPIRIYITKTENPKYVDEEGSILIGTATIDVPFPTAELRSVDVVYMFGDTEISLKATESFYGETCEAKFKLI